MLERENNNSKGKIGNVESKGKVKGKKGNIIRKKKGKGKVKLNERKKKKDKDEESQKNKILGHTDDSSKLESESESENEEKRKKKIEEQAWNWSDGGWSIDPNFRHVYGPKLTLDDFELKDDASYFMKFLPIDYLKMIILPATMKYGSLNSKYFSKLTELMKFLAGV